MNVHFPGFEGAPGFWTVLAFMIVLALGLTAFFRLKRWL
jgi:Mg2+ and Co2+ transporter CorA